MSAILSAHEAGSVALAGGKAAALSALAAQGFDVPAFFVLSADAFVGDDLRSEIVAALPEKLAALGQGPFAVRSSGREEDGASHSHAGQFLSLLDVAADRVAAAAAEVWRSGAAQSLEDYREHRGLVRSGARPAVVVQQMVRARAAGVCFTADPVTGRRDRYLVSAIAGLGDRLVGGEEDGETYVLAAATGLVLEQPESGVLSNADLARLHDVARRVAEARHAFGPYCRVEYARRPK